MKTTRFITTSLFLYILILAISPSKALATTEITHLTVEGRTSPQGIDIEAPRFGWQITSDKKNVMQTCYRIIVASSMEKLNRNMGDVWDSQLVKSDTSQWIALGNNISLKPNTAYYWKVFVKTNRDRTIMSEYAQWSTGMMGDNNWRGSWIGTDSLMPWDSVTRHSRMSARYMRHEFKTNGQVSRAIVHVSGLGLYTLFINGQKTGNDVLTPSPTDYQKSVIYNTYDVTDLLQADNAIGATVAPGLYFAMTQNYQTNVRTTFGYPKLRLNLIIEYANGTADTIATDTSWKITADGPVRYANLYDGECYDARKELKGWTSPGYDDSSWMNANKMNTPSGEMKGNMLPAIQIYKSESPVSLRRIGNRFIADFGTNNSGWIQIHVKAADGDTIRIRHAELLIGDTTLYIDNLRSAEATDYYISNGKPATWEPQYVYHGFRYAEITGINDLSSEDITRKLICDHIDTEGNTIRMSETDSPSILDSIVDNARRGIMSNYKGMPTDCPQRDERMPWLGDRTTGCLGESFLMDVHAIYSKWDNDIREAQRATGSISDVCPAYWRLYTDNITWPAALPFSADMLYRQYGDLRPMKESYAAIKKWINYMRDKYGKDHLITRDKYGDWCVPPENEKMIFSKDPTRNTDGTMISSVYYAYLCRMMARYAKMFGKDADALQFTREADETGDAVNSQYLHNGCYGNGTVTANLLPLATGIVPSEQTDNVIKSLINTIIIKNKTHISSGVIGIQWLLRTLTGIGHGDIAYQIASNSTYPSWGYMVRQHATTIWELWNGNTAAPAMNSGNHVMLLGDLLPWCYENVGGISSDPAHPGFKHIIMRPDFKIKRINDVAARHKSPYGIISSEWHRDEDGDIRWNVTIPANTTATLVMPDGKIRETGSGSYSLKAKCGE